LFSSLTKYEKFEHQKFLKIMTIKCGHLAVVRKSVAEALNYLFDICNTSGPLKEIGTDIHLIAIVSQDSMYNDRSPVCFIDSGT
jgi:hypothetical protein